MYGEDFFIGDVSGEKNSDDFYIGDVAITNNSKDKSCDNDFFLGDGFSNKKAESVSQKTTSNKNPDNRDDSVKKDLLDNVEKIYELLCTGKPQGILYSEYFKTNVDIFEAVGKEPFECLSKNEFKTFEKQCDNWIVSAKKKWKTRKEKLEELEEALSTLKSIFQYEKKTKEYSKFIYDNLWSKLTISLDEKTIDGSLDISEISEFLESAKNVNYWNGKDAVKRDEIIAEIKKYCERKNCIIESYIDTFKKKVEERAEIERLATQQTKTKLFEELSNLKIIDSKVRGKNSDFSEQEIWSDLEQILAENNLLIPNEEFFISDFWQKEKVRSHYDFRLALNSDYFYYLKGTAVHRYQFSEEQWASFVQKNHVTKADDMTVTFIMGTRKEATVQGISKLLESNPNRAAERIRLGDVETYFSHIGRKELAEKIRKVKEASVSDDGQLVAQVVEILSTSETTTEKPETSEDKASIIELVEKSASVKELIKFILNNKSDETLISSLVNDGGLKNQIVSYLFSTAKYSYIKFLMNVLHDMLYENDIANNRYSFEQIAAYIQSLLNRKNDAITFVFVFSPIVTKAKELNLLTEKFVDNFDKDFESAQKTLNDEQNAIAEQNANPKRNFWGLYKNTRG